MYKVTLFTFSSHMMCWFQIVSVLNTKCLKPNIRWDIAILSLSLSLSVFLSLCLSISLSLSVSLSVCLSFCLLPSLSLNHQRFNQNLYMMFLTRLPQSILCTVTTLHVVQFSVNCVSEYKSFIAL